MPNGEDADVLIMEYVKGETLEQWLSGRPEHTKPEDLGNADVNYVADTKIMASFIIKSCQLYAHQCLVQEGVDCRPFYQQTGCCPSRCVSVMHHSHPRSLGNTCLH